jgi:hypothetical protein
MVSFNLYEFITLAAPAAAGHDHPERLSADAE